MKGDLTISKHFLCVHLPLYGLWGRGRGKAIQVEGFSVPPERPAGILPFWGFFKPLALPGTPDLFVPFAQGCREEEGRENFAPCKGDGDNRAGALSRRAPALAYPCPDAPLSRRAPVLTGLCPGVLLLRRTYLPQRLLFRCASVSTCP